MVSAYIHAYQYPLGNSCCGVNAPKGARRRKAMTIEVPTRQQAVTKVVTIPVATKVDGEEKSAEFSCELPATLADAIALYGEKDVFRKFINSLVVYMQGQERLKLRGPVAGKERKRARYMEELNI
jgi:hypothetical protein